MGLENLQSEVFLPTDILRIRDRAGMAQGLPAGELGLREAFALCLTFLLLLQVPSSVVHHVRDSEVAAHFPSDIQYVRLDSPPSFDNTTYSGLPLDPPSGNPPPPPPSSSPPLPPKVLCSRPVTDTFPGADKGGGASCELAQDSSDSQTPPS